MALFQMTATKVKATKTTDNIDTFGAESVKKA
jgi:hypothetical protein